MFVCLFVVLARRHSKLAWGRCSTSSSFRPSSFGARPTGEILFFAALIIARDSNIFEAEVGEPYVPFLAQLDRKLQFVRDRAGGSPVPAVEAIQPELDRLRFKAAERIRDFLLDKIKALRKPNSNRAIQQKLLLKYKALFVFVQENHTPTARELVENYVALMKEYYFRNFQKYLVSTTKLMVRPFLLVSFRFAEFPSCGLRRSWATRTRCWPSRTRRSGRSSGSSARAPCRC